VTVTPAESVLNRLLKFFIWLDTNYPEHGWNQYYNGSEVVWNNIVVSGHSQGSGHAALLGIWYLTAKVIQYGGCTDYYTTGVAPSWTTMVPLTPREKIVGFRSKYEFVCLGAAANWVNLGMQNFGAVVDVENSANTPPYYNSHQLCTSNMPDVGGNYLGLGLLAHIAYIVDGYLPSGSLLTQYEASWTYLAMVDSCGVLTCPNGTYCAVNGSCISTNNIFVETSDPCLCDEGELVNKYFIVWVVIVVCVGIALLVAIPIILICRFRPSPCASCYESCPRCCTFWGDCGKGGD